MEPIDKSESIKRMELFAEAVETLMKLSAENIGINTSEMMTTMFGILFNLLKNHSDGTETEILGLINNMYLTYPSRTERVSPLQKM